jgi:hypothetical protein
MDAQQTDRVSIRLPEPMRAAVWTLARREGNPPSAILRRLVSEGLARANGDGTP